VEAGVLSGPSAEAAVARELAPLLAPSDTPIDTLLLGCTHYPLLRPIIAALAGPQVAIVDSATATASALAELLDINGLRSRDVGNDEAAGSTPVTHRQLTTGDPDTFHALASRLFGSAFPDVERIDLAVAAR
jgi:glutamate racemase